MSSMIERGGVPTSKEQLEMAEAQVAYDNLSPLDKLASQRMWDPYYQRIEPGVHRPKLRRRK